MDRRHQHFNSRRRSRAVTHARASSTTEIARILAESARSALASLVLTLGFAAAAIYVLNYSSVFDFARYRDAGPTIVSLLHDSIPPDFSRWRNWSQPLLDTLAMSAHPGPFSRRWRPFRDRPAGGQNHRAGPASDHCKRRLECFTFRYPLSCGALSFCRRRRVRPAARHAGAGAPRSPPCHSTGMLGKLTRRRWNTSIRRRKNALRSQGVSAP